MLAVGLKMESFKTLMLACCWIENGMTTRVIGTENPDLGPRRGIVSEENGSHPTVEEALERQELVLGGLFF